MKDLILLELESLGKAYQAAQALLTDDKGAEILELFPTHPGALLLLYVSSEKKISPSLNNQMLRIEKPHEELLRGFYNLNHGAIQKGLVILESASLGVLLESAQQLLNQGFTFVDFSWPRLQKRGGFVMMTHSQEKVTPQVSTQVQVTVLPEVHVGLSGYFDL